MKMKILVRDARPGDVYRGETIKKVRMNRKDWNHATIYFRLGGSTWLRRDIEIEIERPPVKR